MRKTLLLSIALMWVLAPLALPAAVAEPVCATATNCADVTPVPFNASLCRQSDCFSVEDRGDAFAVTQTGILLYRTVVVDPSGSVYVESDDRNDGPRDVFWARADDAGAKIEGGRVSDGLVFAGSAGANGAAAEGPGAEVSAGTAGASADASGCSVRSASPDIPASCLPEIPGASDATELVSAIEDDAADVVELVWDATGCRPSPRIPSCR